MKRHPSLVSLSHDHHHALMAAMGLRRATKETATEAAAAFLQQWETEERLHFRLEEEVLLPAYAEHSDLDDPVVARVLLDHVLIRRDAARVADAPTLELLHALGERLTAHVKLEEQQLFPLIESRLPEPALIALGERLQAG